MWSLGMFRLDLPKCPFPTWLLETLSNLLELPAASRIALQETNQSVGVRATTDTSRHYNTRQCLTQPSRMTSCPRWSPTKTDRITLDRQRLQVYFTLRKSCRGSMSLTSISWRKLGSTPPMSSSKPAPRPRACSQSSSKWSYSVTKWNNCTCRLLTPRKTKKHCWGRSKLSETLRGSSQE